MAGRLELTVCLQLEMGLGEVAIADILGELAALGVHPRKGLGQNFLVDKTHRARIVEAAELTIDDVVLEIGPGPGVLTELLCERAGRVVAVELDDRLIPLLRAHFAERPHVQIVHGDILQLDVGQLATQGGDAEAAGGYKVVANLPFYITGAVIPHVLSAQPAPALTVLTLQREVASRLVAVPPDMSLLALGAQFYCTVEIVDRIPAGAFYPVPKVDSAVVRLRPRREPVCGGIGERELFRVAKAGFSQKRKQLRNSLAAGLRVAPAEAARWLEEAGIDPQRRAETLSLAEWGRLASLVVGRE